MSPRSTAARLARWATALEPTAADLALADRALVDTLVGAVAAREHPIGDLVGELPEEGAWAAFAHVLDFDDLHLETTTHISAVCVPAALVAGGDARAYLAGAGAMVRLGLALGWRHYAAGWHATCTAGAPAAAVAAASALDLDADQIATAIALSIPAAGGVQRAFGTSAKALQVGFAVHAGVRAARLAAAGATADPRAVDQWLQLVGGDAARLRLDAERDQEVCDRRAGAGLDRLAVDVDHDAPTSSSAVAKRSGPKTWSRPSPASSAATRSAVTGVRRMPLR